MTIACFGEALAVLVQAQPGPLERSETFTRSLGGAEINVAIALVAQGTPAAVLTRVGNDGFGRFITESLTGFGVDVSGVDVDPDRPTGMYLKEIGGDTGDAHDLGPHVSRMHYYREGSACSALSPALLGSPAVASLLADASIVHTTGITPALSVSALQTQRALFASRRLGQLISFDLNWRPTLWRGRTDAAREILSSFVATADIALLGSDEARAVLGTSDPDALRRRFPEPRWLIVKDDKNTAVGYDGTTRFAVTPDTVDVVETIGAGDAFAAGLLAGLAAHEPLDAAMRRAHATAVRALSSVNDHVGAVDDPADLHSDRVGGGA
ncbi:MAG: sugar kinase [Microbacteriaceae bacterium]